MTHASDNKQSLRFLSVCSGIEAASVAFGPLGWKAVAFSEIEKFPSAVLAHHYPEVPNLGDFTKIKTAELGRVDILCGGTPCQSFSVAGLRKGLGDARGNLTLSFVELAHELADRNGLRNVIWENVVGILSSNDNAFGCFLAGLVGADSAIEPPARGKWPRHGMVSGPKGRAAWAVKDGQFFGIAQRRRRVLVVADFGNGADPAAVLFEPESLPRHPPARGEAGKSITHPIAPSIVSSGRGVERTGDTRGQDPVVAVLRGHSDYGDGLPSVRSAGGDCAGGSEALVFAPEIARCVATREGSSQDYESTTMVAVATLDGHDVARTLSARHDGSPCADRGPNIVAVAFNAEARADQLPSAGRDTDVNDGLMVSQRAAVAITIPIDMRQASRGATMTNNRADGQSGGAPGTGIGKDGDPSPTISTSHPVAAFTGSAVRRLTPMECERLQGFPDGYTASRGAASLLSSAQTARATRHWATAGRFQSSSGSASAFCSSCRSRQRRQMTTTGCVMKWLKGNWLEGGNRNRNNLGHRAGSGIGSLATDCARGKRAVRVGLAAGLCEMFADASVGICRDNLEGLRGCKALGNQGFDVHGGVPWFASFYASFIRALRDAVNKFVEPYKIIRRKSA